MSQNLLATMITSTSYGTWPPGDLRGYVDDGVMLPGDPKLLERAQSLMKSEPVYFSLEEQDILHDAIVAAAEEYKYRLIAVTIERWHTHWLIDHGFDSVEVMVGRLKNRMRRALNRGRIWTEGYDKRFCFTNESVFARFNYIRKHGGYRTVANENAIFASFSPGGAGG